MDHEKIIQAAHEIADRVRATRAARQRAFEAYINHVSSCFAPPACGTCEELASAAEAARIKMLKAIDIEKARSFMEIRGEEQRTHEGQSLS